MKEQSSRVVAMAGRQSKGSRMWDTIDWALRYHDFSVILPAEAWEVMNRRDESVRLAFLDIMSDRRWAESHYYQSLLDIRSGNRSVRSPLIYPAKDWPSIKDYLPQPIREGHDSGSVSLSDHSVVEYLCSSIEIFWDRNRGLVQMPTWLGRVIVVERRFSRHSVGVLRRKILRNLREMDIADLTTTKAWLAAIEIWRPDDPRNLAPREMHRQPSATSEELMMRIVSCLRANPALVVELAECWQLLQDQTLAHRPSLATARKLHSK